MSTLPNIQQLSTQQLIALKSKIEHLQASRAAAQKNLEGRLSEIAQQLSGLAEAAGMTLPQIGSAVQKATVEVGTNGGTHKAPVATKTVKKAKRRIVKAKAPAATPHPTKGVKLPVMYRDPADATKQWSGRGKMPGWMATSGQPKEHFLVKPATA